jgi:hypothetical protein
MFKQVCTAATASGDTTKTLVDTITVPQGVTKLVGIATQMGGAGITTLEGVSGKIELESDDMNIVPANFLTGVIQVVTSGAVYAPPVILPCDYDVIAGGKIKVYITMDMALTVNNTIRCQLTFA